MYKCPNCGQEMIDKKEFCIKCGTRLVKEEKKGNSKILLIVFMGLIFAGAIACYAIANFGTEDEIAPFLPDAQEKVTIEDETSNEEENTEDKEMILFPED